MTPGATAGFEFDKTQLQTFKNHPDANRARYFLEENQNAEKYINGYSILIFSGTERYKADSIFFIADSIYTEHEVVNFYDQPNYRVKIGKFYYRLKANKTLENLKDNFVDAIIVPETSVTFRFPLLSITGITNWETIDPDGYTFALVVVPVIALLL